MLLEKERKEVVLFCNKMVKHGLTKGTGGNISIYNREEQLIAISPSAVDYDEMKTEDVAVIDLKGQQIDGAYKASSEKDMHLMCYLTRKDIQAVVHTHSLYSTILACLNESIPPVHYLIGYAGGEVQCIPYEMFGTMELAEKAVCGLKDKYAVLLGNHGLLSVGHDLDHAFSVAEETEFVAEIYYHTRNDVGKQSILTEKQMADVMKRFESYRKSDPYESTNE